MTHRTTKGFDIPEKYNHLKFDAVKFTPYSSKRTISIIKINVTSFIFSIDICFCI